MIGTPAEEHGNGKAILLGRGAFHGADAAMMVHPAPVDVLAPPLLAFAQFDVRYTGREAHPSVLPEQGINALDALTVAQTAIGLLRQHIRGTDRVHGIIPHGGDAPNVVPAHTAASSMVRARSLEELAEVYAKVVRCFEAGALATGGKVEIARPHAPYADMRHDAEIAAIYGRNAEALGRIFRLLLVAGLVGAGNAANGATAHPPARARARDARRAAAGAVAPRREPPLVRGHSARARLRTVRLSRQAGNGRLAGIRGGGAALGGRALEHPRIGLVADQEATGPPCPETKSG